MGGLDDRGRHAEDEEMMRACTTTGRWRRWGWGVAGAVVLGVMVGWVYRDVGGHGWVAWDDNGYIYENGMVQRGLTWEGVKWAWTTGEQANWHPLTWMSLMLDRELFGDWPGGGHLETAVLHWVNALLLWWVAGRLTGKCWLGWWVALLWAVHPLRVESVAWASERKDVLAALFGLAAVGTYLGGGRETKRGDDERKRGKGRGGMGTGRMWGVAGWLAASLMCKPTLVTLPCLLLLLDAWPLGRWKRGAWRGLVVGKWMLWGVVAASCAATLAVQREAMSSVEAVGVGERVATALTAYGWYLEKWIWPVGLAFFYPRDWAGVSAAGAAEWGVALLALTAVAVWGWKKRGWGWAGTGWLWFLGTLVPMIGLVTVGAQVWADRYSYWPEMGLWLAVACGAEAVVAGRRAAVRMGVMALASVWALGLGWAAREQVATWKDDASLFGRALAVTTGNAAAEGNWGVVLAKEGRWMEALGHLEAAARLERGNGAWWYQLGTVRYQLGDRAGAVEEWQRAVKADGAQWVAMNNLAWVALEEGRTAEARAWIDRAMEHEAARKNAGARDTAEAVRRAEEGAAVEREADAENARRE